MPEKKITERRLYKLLNIFQNEVIDFKKKKCGECNLNWIMSKYVLNIWQGYTNFLTKKKSDKQFQSRIHFCIRICDRRIHVENTAIFFILCA